MYLVVFFSVLLSFCYVAAFQVATKLRLNSPSRRKQFVVCKHFHRWRFLGIGEIVFGVPLRK